MLNEIYRMAKAFKRKYPLTIAWRLWAHSKLLATYLNPEEKIKYLFVGQKTNYAWDIFSTYIIVITNKRLILANKRLLWGHFVTSITPDLFNDLKIKANLIWGKVLIDTLGELVIVSKISKRALDEIETVITENLIREKKKYARLNYQATNH